MASQAGHTVFRLQELLHEVLDPLVPRGADAALLDFPNHNNSGDSAIWLGELRYLRERDVRLRYICDANTYDPADLARSLPASGLILLHGGGNFGDLWPLHHRFRLRVVDDFSNRRIVQLPQTIRTFGEKAAWRPQIGPEGSLVILGRDTASVSQAASIPRADVRLAPDMALFLGSLNRRAMPDMDVVWITRSDHERRYIVPKWVNKEGVLVTDWLAADGAQRVIRSATVRARGLVALAARSSNGHQRLTLLRRTAIAPHELLARRRATHAVDLLSRGRAVVTDRLHGHILCLLLGIPHVLLEDRGGKIRGFVEAFSTDISGVEFAASAEEALATARKLAAAARA